MRVLKVDELNAPWFLDLRDRVIVLNAEVPDPVLRPPLRDYAWLEFEFVLSSQLWQLLSRCASQFGDRKVYVQSDDVNVVENVGHAAAAEFDVNDPTSAYHDFLDLKDPNDPATWSLRELADGLLYWGDSGGWAFVGSRGVELCVLGHDADGGWPLIPKLRFHTFETVLELASGPYRKQLPAHLAAKYETNYRAMSWPIDTPQEG